jgi:hypothetical protein
LGNCKQKQTKRKNAFEGNEPKKWREFLAIVLKCSTFAAAF